jgi:hypothetical protein
MNDREAEYCEHCGAELHHRRVPRVEVAAKPLVEALERPVSE